MHDGVHIRLMATRGIETNPQPGSPPSHRPGQHRDRRRIQAPAARPVRPRAAPVDLHLPLHPARPVRHAPELAQPAEPDHGAHPGLQSRRRRSAHARRCRLRRQRQRHQLLLRARRRRPHLHRPFLLQRHHPRQSARALRQPTPFRSGSATTPSWTSTRRKRRSSPAHSAASPRSARSTAGNWPCRTRDQPNRRTLPLAHRPGLQHAAARLIGTNDAPLPCSLALDRPGQIGRLARAGDVVTREPPPLGLWSMCGLALVMGVVTGYGAVLFRALIGVVHNLLFLGKLSFAYDASVFTPASPWGAAGHPGAGGRLARRHLHRQDLRPRGERPRRARGDGRDLSTAAA